MWQQTLNWWKQQEQNKLEVQNETNCYEMNDLMCGSQQLQQKYIHRTLVT